MSEQTRMVVSKEQETVAVLNENEMWDQQQGYDRCSEPPSPLLRVVLYSPKSCIFLLLS